MGRGLSERQRAVLALIVREHVASKAPVGSDTIVRKYCPGISPATVRLDMVTLASRGYVYRTHSSSGRVPTDEGYRFYVRHLMPPVELSGDERRMIDHQFHQIERDLDQWSQLAATVLAQTTGYASFVTLPLIRSSRLRHLDLIATQDHTALLVALLQEGTLHRHLLALPDRLPQEQLDEIAQHLTRCWRSLRATQIGAWGAARSPAELAVRDALASLMARIDRRAAAEVRYDGISSLLGQPEFVRGEKAQDILRAFEQSQTLVAIADTVRQHQGVQVLVGDENPDPVFRECATVATRYGSDDTAGVIGIIGPTRLHYDRAIATLQYVGGLLTDLWSELRG